MVLEALVNRIKSKIKYWLKEKSGILQDMITDRIPNQVIGGKDPYLIRWWLIPRNRVLNIYIHLFLRSDDDRAFHDHPWDNISIPLGGYFEVTPGKNGNRWRYRKPFRPIFRRAEATHRIVLPDNQYGEIPCWSIFITGPKRRSWYFYCPGGRKIHWKKYTAETPDGNEIGLGCDAEAV